MRGACEASEEIITGIQAVRLENEWLKAVILVGKGTDIWELIYKPLNISLLMRTGPGLEPLRGRDLRKDRLVHYADPYPGGWQDIIPNRARFGNREVGHQREGESCGIPWDYEIKRQEGEISLRCWVSLPYTPLSIEKTFRIRTGEPELYIAEEITNISGELVHFIWTHHPAFGSPLVDEGSQLLLPEGSRAFNMRRYEQNREEPIESFEEETTSVTLAGGKRKNLLKVDAREPGGESCYMPLFGFTHGEAGIYNPNLPFLLRLQWDSDTFPCLRYWSQNDNDMYTVALEPSSSRFSDIDDCLRYNNCITLQPGEKRPAWVNVRLEHPE
ncbi:DUF4432 family protein [Paenibacillus sepulcri]|uniref:DUF4432 family protein n=2 Tax=Paenibacillus sepulcri TaxID=359917 RepID=A0ABS7C415_9BACL|nr:DUF4432 family protein [Paenibacillus sepulcri]